MMAPIRKLIKSALIFAFFSLLYSCKNDIIDTPPVPPEVILAEANINWGTDKESLISYMKGYTQVPQSDANILQFVSKDKRSISYQCKDGKLSGTVVIVPSNYNVSSFVSKEKNYNFVGELNDAKIYENSNINTMASVWEAISPNDSLTAIGFAPITSDLYETIEPIKVTTKECSSIGALRATVSGSVSGIDGYVEAGIIYGKSSDLETNGKKVSVNTNGDFSIDLKDLLDDETYYYCAYCVVDDIHYKGEVLALTTNQLTYTIDGKIFKMIKVEGDGYSFSIMQTELVPNSSFVIDDIPYCLRAIGDHKNVITQIDFIEMLFPLRENTGLNFRLPTQAEWEYAAKGGPKSQGYLYSGSNNIDEVAWYSENSDGKLHEIAQKKPNELGLYDMSGNYAEVCNYSSSKPNNIDYYRKIDGNLCGGSWKDVESNCTPTSWTHAITTGSVEDSKISEYNSLNGYYNTVRLIYTRE